MKTTCTELMALWDEVRNGQADAAGRATFEAHLADCPACAARWRAESRALEALAAERESLPLRDDAFTQAVLARWEAAAQAPAVAGRIGPRSWFSRLRLASPAVAAALVVLAVYLSWPTRVTPPVTPAPPGAAAALGDLVDPLAALPADDIAGSLARLPQSTGAVSLTGVLGLFEVPSHEALSADSADADLPETFDDYLDRGILRG